MTLFDVDFLAFGSSGEAEKAARSGERRENEPAELANERAEALGPEESSARAARRGSMAMIAVMDVSRRNEDLQVLIYW